MREKKEGENRTLFVHPFFSYFWPSLRAIIATFHSLLYFPFFAGIVGMEGAEEKNRGGQIGKVDGTRNWRERELENGNRNRRLNGGNEFREGLAKFRETLL